MTTLREAAQQALEALEQDNPAGRTATIAALQAALAEPQSGWDKWQDQKRGCSVCGICAAPNTTWGYVCQRSDCPTRVTCGVAA